jgi:cyclin-dependent kinase-like
MLEFTRKRRRLYIIFEFVDGNVLDYLESSPNRQISPIIAQEIIWQLLRALEFMHQHRMIHRDVKPENVLYSPLHGVAKLCDFGFARPCAVINGERFTEYVATRWYRAPELLVKEVLYEATVDVWAVGCLLPEMLTGEPLFPGESDLDQLHQIIAVRGYLPKRMVDTFHQHPDFYSRRLPEPKHVPIERLMFNARQQRHNKESNFNQLQLTKDFVEKCLTLDPAYRPGAGHLLHTDYFNQDEFAKRKPLLQEKIKRFNQPNCKSEMRKEKSSSTTKLRNNGNFNSQAKNFDKMTSTTSNISNNNSCNSNEVVKSMPEILNKTVYMKNSRKSNLTKLPKL